MKTSFLQRSRIGKVSFEVEDRRLHIIGNRGFAEINLEVDLADIAPHVERKRWRSGFMVLFPLAIALLAAVATWLLPYPPLSLAGAMVSVGFSWVAIRNIAPIELVIFRSKSGVPVFEIIKDKAQEVEFEAFVAALRAVITKVE